MIIVYWQPPRRSLDGYKHVVDVEYCPPVPSEGPHFPPEAAKAKEAAQNTPSFQNTLEYHDIMEGGEPDAHLSFQSGLYLIHVLWIPLCVIAEEMIRGLQQLGWRKVDVSFHSALWPFLAHNNIHVPHLFLFFYLNRIERNCIYHFVDVLCFAKTGEE